MQDDKIQGILFTKSSTIDLVQRKRHERFVQQMLVKKHALQSWSLRQQDLLMQSLSSDKPVYAVRAKKLHSSDAASLYARLNLHEETEG